MYKTQLRPEEKLSLNMRGLYEQYGYQRYSMGKFEAYSLYAENIDFLAGDRLITFTDLDGRLMALKPDVTLSIIKNSNFAEMLSSSSVQKLYYNENVYRENRERSGFKEISQMGLECIGDVDLYCITEVLALAVKSLAAADENYILEVSHMDFVVELLESMNFSENLKVKILKLIRQKNADGIRKIVDEEKLSGLQAEALCSIPSLYGDVVKTVEKARQFAINAKMNEALDQMLQIYEGLKSMDADKNVQADFSIINHIDYYNGIIFNGYLQELGNCVLAGGQYDGVIRRLGKKGRGIGFALYMNEINRIKRERKEIDVDIAILYDENSSIADITSAVNSFKDEGKTVFAAREISDEVKAAEIYTLRSGELTLINAVEQAAKAEKSVKAANEKTSGNKKSSDGASVNKSDKEGGQNA